MNMRPHLIPEPRMRGSFALRTTVVMALVLALAPLAAAQGNELEEGEPLLTEGCAVTPGGWGAPPSGQNPGSLLHANFDAVFGDELVVGDLVFEDAQEVTDAMPFTGPGSAFPSHAVALAINLAFGEAGLLNGTLQDVVVESNNTTLDGLTAQEILALAEQVLIDDDNIESGEYSDLIEAMTRLNEEFFGCNDFPDCPDDLTATPLANGNILLNWTAVPDADGYLVFRATEDGPFVFLDNTTMTTYLDTATMAGVTYTYTVLTVEGSRVAQDCDEVEVTAIPYFPSAIVGVLALVGTIGALRLFRR